MSFGQSVQYKEWPWWTRWVGLSVSEETPALDIVYLRSYARSYEGYSDASTTYRVEDWRTVTKVVRIFPLLVALKVVKRHPVRLIA